MSSFKVELGISIECSRNGPYIVRNLENLQNSRGESITTRNVIALCRCGGSGNKPFCDGTHSKIGFSSEKLSSGKLNKRVNYEGKKITIHDNRGICSHAGFCTEGLPSVFRLKTEPWIDPDGAEVEDVIQTIGKCPSGALSYTLDGVDYRDQDSEPSIKVSKDGPYRIRGGVELNDEPMGEGASKNRYALCRCGGSKNKPFCDGTHWYLRFKDEKN